MSYKQKHPYLSQLWCMAKWKFREIKKHFCRHQFIPGTTDVKWNEDEQTHTITETCCKCGKRFSFTTPHLNPCRRYHNESH